jgi:hypothetical protein
LLPAAQARNPRLYAFAGAYAGDSSAERLFWCISPAQCFREMLQELHRAPKALAWAGIRETHDYSKKPLAGQTPNRLSLPPAQVYRD